jgi:hypothetical protein
MKTKARVANALRRLANRLDPYEGPREIGIHLQPPEIQQLLGFGLPNPIAPEPDWTWTQTPKGGGGYI